MKRLIVLVFCLLLVLAIIGCSAQKEPVEQPGAAGHAEEVADSTRMDSAAMEPIMDDSTVADSM